MPIKNKNNPIIQIVPEGTIYRSGERIGMNDTDGIPDFSYYSSVNEVVITPIRDSVGFFCFLHELGHAYYHCGTSRPFDRIGVINRELDAWAYALCCVKQSFYSKLIDIAMKCLTTYSGFFIDRDNTKQIKEKLLKKYQQKKEDANVLRYMWDNVVRLDCYHDFTELLRGEGT